MTYLTICDACQDGDHSRHYRVVQAVPEGMLGGSVCRCQGECADGRYEPKLASAIVDLLHTARREGNER